MATLRVVFHFTDRKGQKSETRYWFNPAAMVGHGGGSFAAVLASRLEAVSNARLTGYEVIYSQGAQTGGAPAPNSNCFRRVSLLYRNGANYGSITIPSFVALPGNADDPYGSGRISRRALLVSGLLANVEGIATGILKPDGSQFPSTFIVGGAAGGEPI